ncbi:MAG: TonB-dependent receptor, partial [Akkermansiaceae bacterium]|nr:TonB-dependent receptor [Akkermansiaceae bacterium]
GAITSIRRCFDLVEILKGGSSALYGSDAIGGVVSMQTLQAEDLLKERDYGGLVRTQHFSVNDGFAGQIGGAVRSGDFEFLLLYAGRTGHETKNNGSIPPNPVDFQSQAILANANYIHGEHRFELTMENYQRETDIDARSATTSTFKVFDKSVLNFEQIQRQRVGLKWKYNFASTWIDHLESHLYLQKADTESLNQSRANDVTIGGVTIPGRSRDQKIQFSTDLLGVSSLARKEAYTGEIKHNFIGGIDLSREDSENRFQREDTAMPTVKNRISFAPSTTSRYGLFFQDELHWGERLALIPGLRADYHQIDPSVSEDYLERLAALDQNTITPPEAYDNFTLSPRLDINFKTTEATRLYAGYARGIRNPSAEELSMIFDHPPAGGSPVGAITIPNPKLKEETSHSFKAGYKGEAEAGRFELAGFYTFYKDYIENSVRTGRVDDDGRDILTTLNRGKSIIYGFEASGEWNLGSSISRLDGISVGLSAGRAIGINRTEDTWLNSAEPFKVVSWLGYDDPAEKYGLRMTGIYSAAVNHVDDTTNQGKLFRPDAWFTMDLSVYWKPTDTFTVNAGLNNIFDEKYWSWSSARRGWASRWQCDG